MKKMIYVLLVMVSISTLGSCGNSSSKSDSKPCNDMKSYNIGVEDGRTQKRGEDISGERSSCSEVFEYYHSNSKLSKSCYCKGYRKGHSEG